MKLIPLLNHVLLREGKRDELAIVQKYHIDPDIYRSIREMSPSPTKKYTKYILLMVAKKTFDWHRELGDQQTNILNTKRLRQFFEMNAKKDFSSFKTWDEFKKYMEPYKDWVGKREMSLVKNDPTLAKVVFENDKCEIIRLKDAKAACAYGAGTHWCVSVKQPRQDFFKSYSASSYMYEIISKTLKHSDDPILFKLMLMVPKGEGGPVSIVTADNTQLYIYLESNNVVDAGSSIKGRKVLKYLQGLSVPWDDIVNESTANLKLEDLLVISDNYTKLVDGNLALFKKYLKTHNKTIEDLNIDNFTLTQRQIDGMQLKSLKGISSITLPPQYNLVLSFVTNDELNSYIPKIKTGSDRIEIVVGDTISDFSFLSNINIEGKEQLHQLRIRSISGGVVFINKIAPPQSINKSKFHDIIFYNVIVNNGINLSDYENISASSQVSVSEDKSTLTATLSSDSELELSIYKKYCSMKSVIIHPTNEGSTIYLNNSEGVSVDSIEITKNLNYLNIREFIGNISINSTSKKNIGTLDISESANGLINIHSVNEVVFRSSDKFSVNSTNHIETIKVRECSNTDVSNIDIVELLILETARDFEFPKYVHECIIEDDYARVSFKKTDFEINKLVFSTYTYDRDKISFISKLLKFPEKIEPELSDAVKKEIEITHEKIFGKADKFKEKLHKPEVENNDYEEPHDEVENNDYEEPHDDFNFDDEDEPF